MVRILFRFNMIEIVILYTACVVGLATLTGALVFSDIRGCETMAAFGGHSRVPLQLIPLIPLISLFF